MRSIALLLLCQRLWLCKKETKAPGARTLPDLRAFLRCPSGSKLEGLLTIDSILKLKQLEVRKGGFGTPAEMLGRGSRLPPLLSIVSTQTDDQ